MRVRLICVLSLAVGLGPHVFAETGHSGPMQTSTTTTSSSSSGGSSMATGGGGGGGNSGGMYQSHAQQIQQSFQQPLQDAEKQVSDASQNASKSIQQAESDATKAISSNIAKDTPIDDKTAAAISTPPPLDTTAIDKSTDAIVSDLQNLTKTAVSGIAKMGDALLAIEGLNMPQQPKASLGQMVHEASAARGTFGLQTLDGVVRTPAAIGGLQSPTSGASGPASTAVVTSPMTGMKTFQSGLLHNPPDGLNIE